ncbi:MAG: hypothetical protein ABR907_00635 [Terracidiphilus sp.]|jgi:hypothetical protein
MMFPDTANEKQNAALRLAAERSHAACNPSNPSSPSNALDQYERSLRNVFSSVRESSSGARQLAHYIQAQEVLHSVPR